MKFAIGNPLRGIAMAGVIGLAGCAYRLSAPGLTVTNEPAPAGYAYDDGYGNPIYDSVYYDAGWYDGPNWYWYGPNHRLFHEFRADHERRYRAYHHRDWR